MNWPGTIEKTVDKHYTSNHLEDAELPTPRTVVTESFAEAKVSFPGPRKRCNGEASLQVCMYRNTSPHNNWDIRALVVGDEVVAAMVRRGTGCKTNIAQGARGEPLNLTPVLEELSLKAAPGVDADYVGGYPVFCGEAALGSLWQRHPGWRALQKTTDIDIADRIVKHVLGTS